MSEVTASTVVRKGRSAELLERRNEHILYRYYFYLKYDDKRSDVVLRLLSEQFYLAEATIHEIIHETAASDEVLLRIKKEMPSEAQLRRKFKFF